MIGVQRARPAAARPAPAALGSGARRDRRRTGHDRLGKRRIDDRRGTAAANLASRPSAACCWASRSEPDAKTELGVVFEQAVAPGGPASFVVGAIRGRRQVAAVVLLQPVALAISR